MYGSGDEMGDETRETQVTSSEAGPGAVALAAKAIACQRSERWLFRDLSFSLAAGEALLLRGPNGSGKSSLLRLLAGLLPLSAGSLRWRGREPGTAAPEYRTELAYLGHLDALKPQLLLRENLQFWADLLGSTADLDEIVERVGLTPCADLPGQHLSAGQRRRFGLARLLLKPVPLWLLDEPTTALDAAGQELSLELIDRHLAGGGIAVVSSHEPIVIARSRTLTLGAGGGNPS